MRLIISFIVLFLWILTVSSEVSTQEKQEAIWDIQDIQFVEAAFDRLFAETKRKAEQYRILEENVGYANTEAKLLSKELEKELQENKELRRRYAEFRTYGKEWIISELLEKVSQIFEERNLKSSVTFITLSNGKETLGATIKYQGKVDRWKDYEATTAKGLTTCTEEVTPGRYYIWSERKGDITSNPNDLYTILVAKPPPIIIPESLKGVGNK